MKEELNRYYLIEYQDSRDTIISSNEEYSKIVASAKKNNKNEKNQILIGNIERYTDKRGRVHVVEHMYNILILYCTKTSNVLFCTMENSMQQKANWQDSIKFCLNIY